LRGSEARTLTKVGAVRVVPANDLRDKFEQSLDPRNGELWHLRESGLVNTIRLERDTNVVTLTREGRDLLESTRHDRDAPDRQAFHAGIQRPGAPDRNDHQQHVRLRNWSGSSQSLRLREIGFAANRRLLHVEYLSHDCLIGDDHLDALTQPVVVDTQRAAASAWGIVACSP
jgi:DNA-binding PadR family transcriptional regulator